MKKNFLDKEIAKATKHLATLKPSKKKTKRTPLISPDLTAKINKVMKGETIGSKLSPTQTEKLDSILSSPVPTRRVKSDDEYTIARYAINVGTNKKIKSAAILASRTVMVFYGDVLQVIADDFPDLLNAIALRDETRIARMKDSITKA